MTAKDKEAPQPTARELAGSAILLAIIFLLLLGV